MTGPIYPPPDMDWGAVLDSWCILVRELIEEIRLWTREANWDATPGLVERTEDHLGSYQLPYLTIGLPGHQVTVEPYGRLIPGADGRVDISAWPSEKRVLLLRKGDRWLIRPEAGLPWPDAWNRETFDRIVQYLTG